MFERIFRRHASPTLFAPPERVEKRTDSTDDVERPSAARRVLTGTLLGAVAVTGLAPTIQTVSEVWQGKDRFVGFGGGR
jgi:hypothetical protein